MKNSYFHFLLIVLILGFAGLGYWSYSSITFDFGGESTEPRIVTPDTEQAPADVPPPAPEIVQPTTGPEQASAQAPQQTAAPATTTNPSGTVPEKYKTLAGKLSRLITDNIHMKIGSKGTRVGTVQEFINIYENKSSPIDNKYGAGLQRDVTEFQTAVGDTADGLADPGTYQKMIDWLKTQ